MTNRATHNLENLELNIKTKDQANVVAFVTEDVRFLAEQASVIGQHFFETYLEGKSKKEALRHEISYRPEMVNMLYYTFMQIVNDVSSELDEIIDYCEKIKSEG